MTKAKTRKTTEEDFQSFKQEAQKIINFLGLHNWSYNFLHQRLPENQIASIFYNMDGKDVSVVLTTHCLSTYYSKEEILASARHEICECLLARMDSLAKDRQTTEEQINEARHEIIAVLQNTLFRLIT